MNKTLFLIRGVSGSGKTTTANILSENGKYPVLSADMYFEDEHRNYNWDGNKIKDAHAWCKSQVSCIMSGEYQFIFFPNQKPVFFSDNDKIFVANTFTQEWEMEDYFNLAEKYSYQVVSLIVENRHGGKNVHDVNDETLEKIAYVFDVIEYERGYGNKLDGYICFKDQDAAELFLKNIHDKRRSEKNVPDYYVNYENGRYSPVSKKTFDKLNNDAYYTNNL